MERPRDLVRVEHPRCPFCHEPTAPDLPRTGCAQCTAWSHDACLHEGGKRCAACGTSVTPGTSAPRGQPIVAPRGPGAVERGLAPDPWQARVSAVGRALFMSHRLIGLRLAITVLPALVLWACWDPLGHSRKAPHRAIALALFLMSMFGALITSCAAGHWWESRRQRPTRRQPPGAH